MISINVYTIQCYENKPRTLTENTAFKKRKVTFHELYHACSAPFAPCNKLKRKCSCRFYFLCRDLLTLTHECIIPTSLRVSFFCNSILGRFDLWL